MSGQIYLIGFMGSGKSVVSRCLARFMQRQWVEMDELLAEQAGKPITQIFEEDGEEAFRQMESALLCRIGAGEPAIVSCGGGVVLRTENVDYMKKTGTVVLLSATSETIYERVRHSTHRPVLKGHMNVPDIAEMMAKREPYYQAAADLIVSVDGKTSEIVAEEVRRRLLTE